jgi:DNA-binding response OmpR family regulator
MATIVVSNFAEAPAARLADLLRLRGNRVLVCDHTQSISRSIGSTDVDLIILDVSKDDAHVRERLAEVRHCRERRGIKPLLLCVSMIYRGARFELDLERKGARFLYVY